MEPSRIPPRQWPIQRSSSPPLSDPLVEPTLEMSPSQINSMEADMETSMIPSHGVEAQLLSSENPQTSPSRDNEPSITSLDIVPDALLPPPYLGNIVGHILEMGPPDELKYTFPPKLNNVTYSSPAAAAAINAQIKEARTALSQIRKERKASRLANGIVTRGSLAKRDRLKLSRAMQRKAEATLLKEARMQREAMRARQTRIDPEMIKTLDIPVLDELYGDSKGPESKMARLNPVSALIKRIMKFVYAMPARLLAPSIQPWILTPSRPPSDGAVTQETPTGDGRLMETEWEPWGFEGEIVIQKRLDAMAQALSEHTQDSTLQKEPGRHSYYVDAAVSRDNGLTGLAVVYMSHRQDGDSPWTVQGYRLPTALDQHDAETWAIWQSLQCILEKAKADRDSEKPPDPCYLAVIYSDSKSALQSISNNSGGVKVQEIIRQSVELKKLGVGVQLQWVPGHRNVPGNELADLVSKKARLFPWHDLDLS